MAVSLDGLCMRNAGMQHYPWCCSAAASPKAVMDKMGCLSYQWRCAMLEYVRDWLIRWRVFRRLRDELLQHNHRELYDLGIGPGDIDRIAWRGACDAGSWPGVSALGWR
jgi:uncharacterized protein YjiS (DUF1127 family)